MAQSLKMVMYEIIYKLPFDLAYIDDIVFYRNKEVHIEYVLVVIEFPSKYSFPIWVRKSIFGQKMVRLLRFVISGSEINTGNEK